MVKWTKLIITLSLGLFFLSNQAVAKFMSVDPVGALQHINQGNIQGFNRYAYVNNNPYRYTDPDGRVLVAVGGEKDVSRINGMISKIESASPTLKGKVQQLKDSKNLHFISQSAKGENPRNTAMGSAGNDTNGVGTGSDTVLDLNNSVTIPNGNGGTFTSSPEGVLAHELIGHAADVDKGIAGDTSTQAGKDKSENSAMKMGNAYREANKEPLRKEY